MEEAKNEINDLEHKEAKKQPIRTTKRKKEFKTLGIRMLKELSEDLNSIKMI